MRGKNKSRRIKVILFACIVVIGIAIFLVISNNKNSTLVSNVNKENKSIIELVDDENNIDEELIVEDKGEESTTNEIKTEVSNTPKSEEKKKVVNNQIKSNTNKQESTINQDQPIQQPTTTPKQEEVVNSSNQDNGSNIETPKENTDLYNSITHGQWETDINDSSSLCEAKGVRIANNELNAILDWNELHEEEQKQPIINYSRCYPVIKDGVKHWYLHFFTTKGEGMDTELKNKYS
jgi:FtsZ-interacting cell division protein ZipA